MFANMQQLAQLAHVDEIKPRGPHKAQSLLFFVSPRRLSVKKIETEWISS